MSACRDMRLDRANTGHLILAILGDAWSGGGKVLIESGLYWEHVWQLVAQDVFSEE